MSLRVEKVAMRAAKEQIDLFQEYAEEERDTANIIQAAEVLCCSLKAFRAALTSLLKKKGIKEVTPGSALHEELRRSTSTTYGPSGYDLEEVNEYFAKLGQEKSASALKQRQRKKESNGSRNL